MTGATLGLHEVDAREREPGDPGVALAIGSWRGPSSSRCELLLREPRRRRLRSTPRDHIEASVHIDDEISRRDSRRDEAPFGKGEVPAHEHPAKSLGVARRQRRDDREERRREHARDVVAIEEGEERACDAQRFVLPHLRRCALEPSELRGGE